jgi:hypothetical protein
MNERIEELIKQAGPNSEGELHFADRTNIHVIDVKKFAELLVKECWTTISPFIEDDNLAEDALAELKEHFGVEE